MNDIILPIGSVVKLIESDSKVIVLGYLMKSKNNGYIYDYCGCEYPIGIKNIKNYLYFDTIDITSIIKLGYIDKETVFVQEKIRLYKEIRKEKNE